MKKAILILSIILIPSFIFAKDKNKTIKSSETWKNKYFTQDELKKYNGENGMPVYVAVDGIVYDVTKSKYWKTGKHMNIHQAGNDLTKEIKTQAPQKIHKGGKILEKFPKVGILKKETPQENTNKQKEEDNTKQKPQKENNATK